MRQPLILPRVLIYMESEPSATRRLAMLVDGDNAEAKLLTQILEEASKHGTVTIRRIYGDWTSPSMGQWRDVASSHAFQTPHQLLSVSGKNATDTFLIIDAMDLLHSGHIEGFCIVSSDSDFTGLAKRIREEGMFVMGVGKATTPKPFKKACEVFTNVELLSDPADTGAEEMRGGNEPDDGELPEPGRGPEPTAPDWTEVVIKAIRMTAQEEWSRLAAIGDAIRRIDSSFDARAHGCKTLLPLVMTKPDLFEVVKATEGTHVGPLRQVRGR